MYFNALVALIALTVGASAQTPIPANVQQSVLIVLASAIPTDQVSYALASQSAFASAMASSLAAGNTPAWYQALPSDVKSLLPQIYPYSAQATPTPSASASGSPSGTPVATSSSIGTAITPFATGVNSTTVSVRSPTLSATASRSASASGPQSTGGASFPSVAFGAGLGAALGFIGMLAL